MPQVTPASFFLQMGKLRLERGSDSSEITQQDRSSQSSPCCPTLPLSGSLSWAAYSDQQDKSAREQLTEGEGTAQAAGSA